MKNWKCKIGFHDFSKWKYVETSGIVIRYDTLIKVCKRCGKKKTYKGFTNTCIITGEKAPYTYMD